MERLFNLDAQLVFDALLLGVSVFIMFTFLSYLLFEPARKVLEHRKETIQNQFADIEHQQQQAMGFKKEYEQRLQQVEEELQQMRRLAKEQTREHNKKLMEEAKEEATKIRQRAKRDAALEREQVQDDMKKEIILLAVELAGKIISVNMNRQIMENLYHETIEEMGKSLWGRMG